MNALTPRQSELLHHITRFIAQGRSPLTSELIEAMGLARESSLTDLLRPLQRKGYIHIQGGVRGRQRIIELTTRGRALGKLGAPVLGAVTAGPLREALCDPEEVVVTLAEAINFRPGDFLLRVQGDSMIGDGIQDGDKVLLRPDVVPHNGEIVCAQVMHEDREWQTTLKRLYAEPSASRLDLRASNPCYEPLWIPRDQVAVAGVYRGLLREV